MKAPKVSQDQALATISAEVVQILPHLTRLKDAAQHADDITRGLALLLDVAHVVLSRHLSHTMDSPRAEPEQAPQPAKRKAGTNRGAKRAAAQAAA